MKLNNKLIKKIKGMNILIFLLPVLLLAGCGNGNGDTNFLKAEKLLEYDEHKYDDMEATGELVDGVRVINIKAYQFFFEPTLIVVNKGEKIKVIVEAMDVPHGFEIEGLNIPGYDIDTVIRKGIPLELEFVADEKGVWEFICTIFCGFGHSTMKGTWVIR